MMHRDCPEEKKKKIEDFFAVTIARMMDANGNIQCVTIPKMIVATADSQYRNIKHGLEFIHDTRTTMISFK